MKITVNVNQKQAREFARVVCADIKEYIQSHSEEYQNFLAEEYGIDNTIAVDKTA